jgi:hypothetical protein
LCDPLQEDDDDEGSLSPPRGGVRSRPTLSQIEEIDRAVAQAVHNLQKLQVCTSGKQILFGKKISFCMFFILSAYSGVLYPDRYPDSMGSLDLDPDSQNRSGSRRTKMTHKNRNSY